MTGRTSSRSRGRERHLRRKATTDATGAPDVGARHSAPGRLTENVEVRMRAGSWPVHVAGLRTAVPT